MQKEFHRHINTTLLKKHHKDVYRNLFQNCPIVISAPTTYPLSPTYAIGPGGIGIVSKLPFRHYLGIEPIASGGVQFGPTLYYHPEEDKFVEWDTTRTNPIFLKVLEDVAMENGKKANVRLWGLTEMPWYRGLNIDSLYAVPCAAAWLLYLDILSSEEIKKAVSEPFSKDNNKPKALDKILRLALRLESIIANWVADGHLIFGSLVKSQYPTVFFRERDPILFDHYRDFGIKHPSSYYNICEGLFYQGLRMDELFDLPNPLWSVDMAIIFTGEETDSRDIYPIRRAVKARLEEEAKFAQKTFKNLIPKNFRESPQFLKLIGENPHQSPGMNLFRTYRDDSVVHSITVLKTIYNLFQYGIASSTIRDFINAQNINQDILRILGLSPLVIDQACAIIREIGSKMVETGVATKLIGIGGAGCLMVFGPIKSLESVLNKALPVLQSSLKKPVHCHWASWCDSNNESDGIVIEQNIKEKIYSDLIPKKTLTVLVWHKNNKFAQTLTPEKWEAERKKFDLVFDDEERKIYINGKPLTSSQIHSAKQTIEIFKILFDKDTATLHSSDLPRSSYSVDRNQMESKIVRPLVSVFKKYTHRRLNFSVSGGLGSNFSVIFKPDSLMIGLVSKK